MLHTGFGHRIRLQADTGGVGADRAEVHDRATGSLRPHHPARMLDAQEDTAQHDIEGVIPVLHLDFGQRAEGPAHTRGVHQHVDAAVGVHRLRDGGLEIGFRAHVRAHERHPVGGALIAEGRQCLLGDLLVQIRDDHGESAIQEAGHRGAAHTARATGHQGNLSGHVIPTFSMRLCYTAFA